MHFIFAWISCRVDLLLECCQVKCHRINLCLLILDLAVQLILDVTELIQQLLDF